MSIHISADANQPSATIEIPLENPLPDYDLHQLEQPTPRDVDALLVSQGFRDLVDDARGVLMELLAHPPYQANSPETPISISRIPLHCLSNSRNSLAPSAPAATNLPPRHLDRPPRSSRQTRNCSSPVHPGAHRLHRPRTRQAPPARVAAPLASRTCVLSGGSGSFSDYRVRDLHLKCYKTTDCLSDIRL